MAQVKAACATTTTTTTISDTTSPPEEEETSRTMPVASVTLCEEGDEKELSLMPQVEELEEGADACQAAAVEEVEPAAEDGVPSNAPCLILPEADNLSVSSPDSGHGTTSSQSDGQSEQDLHPAPHHSIHQHHHLPHHHHHHHHLHQQHMMMSADGMTAVMPDPSMLPHPMHYPWINGQAHHQHRVMEPVAINPETGFTTVLVDASAMAGYPHHLPAGVTAAPWPPHHHHHHGGYAPHHHHHHVHGIPAGHFQAQQQHPPPHFLHPHAYHPHDPMADYSVGYMGGAVPTYDSTGLLSAPPYDPNAAMFDPSSMGHMGTNGNNATHFGANKSGAMGRNHRSTRGSSVSPKRPTNRSASQNSNNNNNNNQRQRSGGSGQQSASTTSSGGGRYTPSPSSGRSRGSSPGQPSLISNRQSVNHGSNSTGSVPAGPAPPNTPGQHVVHLHVNPGETVSLQMGGQVQVIQGKTRRLCFPSFFF